MSEGEGDKKWNCRHAVPSFFLTYKRSPGGDSLNGLYCVSVDSALVYRYGATENFNFFLRGEVVWREEKSFGSVAAGTAPPGNVENVRRRQTERC